MDSLGLDLDLDASRSNVVCSSVHELQDRLHHLIASRCTPTRAARTTVTYELRAHTTLYLVDDSAATPTPAPVEHVDGAEQPPQPPPPPPVTRTVLASEAVLNQPSDDPVLQKDIAKHLTAAVGAIDGSAWNVRQVARGQQGWTFTYICKDSLQAWNRANAKNPQRPVIGGFSGKDGLDPINLSRPAFDCRGSLTIAFSKLSRGIIVKYEHTPLHRTVVQLVDSLAPIPPPVRQGNNANSRTPKAKRAPGADGEEGTRSKKRTPKGKRPSGTEADGEGEEVSAKKKTSKRKRPASMPGAGDPEGENRSKRQKKKGKSLGAVSQDGLEIGTDPNTTGTQNQPPNAVDQVSTAFLNVPPAEAERRRQTAVGLLNTKGIPPDTLSAEQFNIFANQAPELQSTSLEMLARYGAERLRIVHPNDKEQAASSTSTPLQGDSADVSPAPASLSTSNNVNTPTRRPRGKKKGSDGHLTEVSIGNGAVVPIEQTGQLGTTESALKPKKARVTRGACDTCKQRKVKCTKEHPACSVCENADVQCVYLPPKPRRKSEKSAEVVENDDSDDAEEESYVQHETVPQNLEAPIAPQSVPQPAGVAQTMQDVDNEEFIPDPNILSGPVEHHPYAATQHGNDNFYGHSHSGIDFPPMNSHASASTNSMPTLTYPQSQTQDNFQQSGANLDFPSTSVHQQHQSPGVPLSQPVSTSASSQRRQSGASSRKSLPTTSQAKQTPVPPPSIPNHAPGWNTSPTVNQATTASPIVSHQQTATRPRSRKSRAEPEQQIQAGSQSTNNQSPMTRSPYQSAAHVNSRQARRAQTNTPPVITNSRPPPQAPGSTHHQTSASAASHHTSSASGSVPAYDNYSRYNNDSSTPYTGSRSNDPNSSSRASYETSSYHSTTATTTAAPYTSTSSYDYGRSSGATNPLSQALNSTTEYNGTNTSSASQWPTSQTRGQNTTSSNAYSTTTTGSHDYATRSGDGRSSNQHTPYSQPQSQSFNAYSSHQPSLSQQNQQQNWYGFTPANSSNQNHYGGNRQSGFSAHRSNVPAYSNQYAGAEDQTIYDLIRASGSNH